VVVDDADRVGRLVTVGVVVGRLGESVGGRIGQPVVAVALAVALGMLTGA